MRSEKNTAREFQDWVTREVLPSIRKTGGYLLNEDMRSTAAADSREEFPMPTTLAEALRLAADLEERRAAQERMTQELAAAREADKPKVDFVDNYVDAAGTMSLSDAARTLGYSSPGAFTKALNDGSGQLLTKLNEIALARFRGGVAFDASACGDVQYGG